MILAAYSSVVRMSIFGWRHSCSVRTVRILRLGKSSGTLWNFTNFTFYGTICRHFIAGFATPNTFPHYSCIVWARRCTVFVAGHIRTFVSMIEVVLLVTQRIQCNGPPTLLKRLIRSLTLLQTRSDSLGMTVLLTFRPYSICPNHRRIQGRGVGRRPLTFQWLYQQ